jgi:hypothetical protein
MLEKSRLSYIKMGLKGYPAKYGSPEGYPGVKTENLKLNNDACY